MSVQQIREAIILSGGLGTRLRGVVDDIPKPMAPVAGKPFLEHLLDELSNYGFEHIVLAVGYKHEVIQDYFGNSYKDIKLSYSIEKELLGTGGAILQASNFLHSEETFVINGDTFFKVDYAQMEEKAKFLKSDLCIALKPMKNFDRYGSVKLKEKRVIGFKEKQKLSEGLINGGIYWLKKTLLNTYHSEIRFSFETDLMPKELTSKNITGFVSDAYFIDIGIPEDYKMANAYFSDVLSK